MKSDELLVKFSSGPGQSGLSASLRRSSMARAANGSVGSQVLKDYSRIGWQRVRLPKGVTVTQALARYKNLAGVVSVEPNYRWQALAIPNDPSYSSLWGMTKIKAPVAWDTATGSSDVVVAVVDTGVRYTHEDLSANMWHNPGEIAGNGIDDDANGFVDDVYGLDAVNNDSNPMDDHYHGTHVAGTIGGVGNNGKGIAGVNWNVKIMALKFLDSGGYGSTGDAIECYQYATMMKQRGINLRVINNSWGGGPFSQALKDAIDAAGNAGILSACAAGNGDWDQIGDDNDLTPFYPACYDSSSIISVAASDSSDARASFSNYGATTVDLAAPGVDILSSLATSDTSYGNLSGTSMATPHVVGAAALLCAANNGLSVAALKSTLMQSVDALPQWSGKVASGGRLNLAQALAQSGSDVVLTAPASNSSVGENFTLRATTSDSSKVQKVEFSQRPQRLVPALTRTPATYIPYNSTVSDTAALASTSVIGEATVSVNITHYYTTDLVVTLFAPDGSSTILHNHASGTNIIRNYDVSAALAGKSMAGNWKLEIKNGTYGYSGTLNSWGLSFQEKWAPISTDTDGPDANAEWTADWNTQSLAGGLYQVRAVATLNSGLTVSDINDNIAIGHLISITDVTLTEGNEGTTDAVFTVTLSRAGTQTITVNYATSDGTATAGSDYTATSGTLDFAPGETSKTIRVPVTGDTLVEADETFSVNLTDAPNATILDGIGNAIIVSDELPSLSINDVSVVEGTGGTVTATFTVTLTAAISQPVTVTYYTANDTATYSADYTYTSGTLTFAPGTTTRTIAVSILTDTMDEPDERFFVNLSNPTNATIADNQGICLISDDDVVPTVTINDAAATEGNSSSTALNFTVSLSNASSQTITVAYATADGTATAGSDYTAISGSLTFSSGVTTRTLSVPIIGDVNMESTENFFVNLSAPVNATISDNQAVGTINADDGLSISDVTVTEGDTGTVNAVFTVTLSAAIGQDVTVDYATANGTATAGSDYTANNGTLTIVAGQTSATISVAVAGDTAIEANETFFINLSNTQNAPLIDAQGLATITNDDFPTISVGDFTASENASSLPAIITLSQPATQPITISYTTSDGTATAGKDYSAKSGTYTMGVGSTGFYFDVSILPDTIDEANETIIVKISNPVNARLDRAQAVLTITDDDPAPTISLGDTTTVEGNNGTTDAVFTASLSNASSQPITVDYTTSDGTATAGSDYTATSGTLTIPAGQYSANIVVPILGDTDPEANEAYSITLTNAINASIGKSVGSGTIVNDEGLFISDATVTEGNSETTDAVFTVTLTSALTQDVTVDYTTADYTAKGGSDFTPTSGTLTLLAGETSATIAVPVLGDTLVEPRELFFVRLSNPLNTVLADSQGTGIILNDDTSSGGIGGGKIAFQSTRDNSFYPFLYVMNADGSNQTRLTSAFYDQSPAFNQDGSKLVFQSARLGNQIWVMNADGSGQTALTSGSYYNLSPAFSPDGSKITFQSNRDGNYEIYVMNADGTGQTRLTSNGLSDAAPGFSPDGSKITFQSDRDGNNEIYVMNADGTGQTRLTNNTSSDAAPCFNPDGSKIAFSSARNGSPEIYVMNVDGSNQTRLTTNTSDDSAPCFSPDGSQIAFQSSRDGNAEIYTMNADGSSQTRLTSNTATDAEPAWAPGSVEYSLSISGATVIEGNSGTTNAVFTVTRSNIGAQDITVNYETADSSAKAGSDYTASSGTLTIPAGQTSANIVVPVLGDTLVESDESFYIKLSNAQNGVFTSSTGICTITNDDLPALSINDVSVTEGNSSSVTAQFTVTLSAPVSQTVTVAYDTADGTAPGASATAGSDYTATSGTLTFSANQVSKTVSVPVLGDTQVESNETFFVNLSNATNATITDSQGIGTINNDDLPKVSVNDISVNEGNNGTTNAVFSVTIPGASNLDITMSYATVDGTAKAGSDYTAVSGTLTIPAGQTSATITVPVLGDTLVESNESFSIQLANIQNGTFTRSSAVCTIISDELPTLSINDVSVTEGNSGSVAAQFTVTLSAPVTQTVTVAFATADDTALAGSDYTAATGTLTFYPNEVSKTLPVTVKGDTSVELNETFFLNLSNSVNATLADAQGVATVLNDDFPSVSINDISAIEGSSGTTNAVFTVTMPFASTQDVRMDYATVDSTAKAGSDYTAVNGTLTIPVGQTTATIIVPVSGDTLVESNETFSLQLSNIQNGVFTRSTGICTITNDDLPTLSINDVSVTEGNSSVTAQFTVTLSAPVSQTVTVAYDTADGTATAGNDYTPASGTLTFFANEVTKTISVSIIGDTQMENNETFTLNLNAATNATIAGSQGIGTIVDNDAPIFSISDAMVVEGNRGATNYAVFTVSLSRTAAQDVTVDYASADYTAKAGSDYISSSGTLTIPAGQTTASLSVQVLGDVIEEPQEIFYVNLSNTQNAVVLNGQGNGLIKDDDQSVLGDKIVFQSERDGNSEIYVMNDDGSNPNRLTNNPAADHFPRVSADGSKIVFISNRDGREEIYIMNADGSEQTRLTNTSGYEYYPSFSPDGTQIVFLGDRPETGSSEIYVINADGSNERRVTNNNAGDLNPCFTPDGKRIVFASFRADDGSPNVDIYSINVDGSDEKRLTSVLARDDSPIVSPDGTKIVYASAASSGTGFLDIYTMGIDGTNQSRLTNRATNEQQPCISPDSKRIAFSVDSSGIYTMNADGSNQKMISSQRDTCPSWAIGHVLGHLTISDVLYPEGSYTDEARFTVTLDSRSNEPVMVDYSTIDGTAHTNADFDYAAVSGTLIFNPGEISKIITVPVWNDSIDEDDETFFVNLSNPRGTILARSQGIGTIIDNDSPPSIIIDNVTIAEGNPVQGEAGNAVTAKFTIGLSAVSGRTVTVDYATSDGATNPATAGVDYKTTINTLIFAPGEVTKIITVPIIGDVIDEIDETFFVNLNNATNAVLPRTYGLGIINDDDAPPLLAISDVSVKEGNPEAPGSVKANFTISLSAVSSKTVTVKYATATPSSNAATADVDYTAVPLTTLTFAPGETSKLISVPIIGDTMDEVDERFQVNLSSPTNATLGDKEGFCTIVDDDAAPSLVIDNVTVTEGNPVQGAPGTTPATFTVSLSAPSGKTVTVQYYTSTPGTNPATADTDYVALPTTTLSFAPGETSKPITVQVNGDLLDEVNELFSVNLKNAGNATIADKEGFCTINDDDAAPSLRINDVSQEEGNSGTTAFTFNVTLSAASGKAVTVKYQTALPGSLIATPDVDYVAVPITTLTFAPGETTKTITVFVNGDTALEGMERFVVKLSSSANATIADSEGFGTIVNDDVSVLLFDGEPST